MILAMMWAARDYVRAKMIADETLAESFKELSELAGDPPDIETLPEGFVLYEVRGVIEDSPEPEERHVIYVKCREVKGDLTILKDWMIEVNVYTPVDVKGKGVTLAGHSALEMAVGRVFDKGLHESPEADLADEIEAKAPGWTGGGFHAMGWSEARDGESLVPVYEVKAGVMKS